MKFVFVIPTLNRGKYLSWPVESILDQAGNHDVNVIISDNCSEDNTAEIVQSFGDSRISYFRAPRRMSMSRHWRFALSKVDLEGCVVCILGDDDVVAPDALDIVSQAFEKFPIQAILRKTGYYFTPDCQSPHAGWLYCPCIDGSVKIRESREILEKVAAGQLHYGELPSIYHGFVGGDLVRAVLSRADIFDIASPDIASAIALAAHGHTYATFNYPLTLGVASPSSNGLNTVLGSKIGEEFFETSEREMSHRFFLRSVALQVLEAIHKYAPVFNRHPTINFHHFYREALADIRQSDVESAIASLCEISGKGRRGVLFDYRMVRSRIWVKNLMKMVVGYRGGGIRIRLLSRTHNSRGFAFSGMASELGRIDSPIDCLNIIRSKVGLVDWVANEE